MIRLSNLADYAVVVMTAAARSPAPRLSAAAVAATTGVPEPTVAKLMGVLTRAGLLASVRGAQGGFALSRPAGSITVADVVEAVEGPITLTPCAHATPSDCALEAGCSVRPHWAPVNRAVRDALAAVTLADIAAPAARALEIA